MPSGVPPGGFVGKQIKALLVCIMAALSPETLNLLLTVLDETWDSLRPEEKSRTSKEQIGVRLLEKARAGEMDPFRLRIASVSGVVTYPL